jgi:hypothetical protein
MKSSKLSKLLSLTALSISAIFLIIPMGKSLASGEFSRTCTDERLTANLRTNRTSLLASCTRRNGSVNKNALINISEYIANDDGKLNWRKGGQFQRSCRPPQLRFNQGAVLLTTCKTRNNTEVSASIRLDDHIANIDGELKYEP